MIFRTPRLWAVALLLSVLNLHADIQEGLIGYWPLDGDALDYSGNGYHGNLLTGASFVENPTGTGLVLQTQWSDQKDQGHVQVGLPPSEHPGIDSEGFQGSGSVWVWYDDRQGLHPASDWQGLLGHPPGILYVERQMTHNWIKTMVKRPDSSANAWPNSGAQSVVEEGQWHHIAWTFQAPGPGIQGSLRWYVNGQLANEYTDGYRTLNTSNFRIGSDY